MSRFLRRDPIKKAKSHVDKALEELEEGFPDYASQEFERAARLFLEEQEIDFAVKYFREASFAALEANKHLRTADMKICAGDALLMDNRFDAAGALFSEASDHQFRENRVNDSAKSLSSAILCYLASRNFDTAVNLQRKADKRFAGKDFVKRPGMALSRTCVAVLCEGQTTTDSDLKRAKSAARVRESEAFLVDFVIKSVGLALQT
ncbi:MAG: hypothetical protein ACFFAY_06335, partial [Promethearchaeota archaeon]